LFAQSDLSFVVIFFALFRLGYKVLTISIRLGAPACLVLLERADCATVLHGGTRHITTTLAEVSVARSDLTLKPMLPRSAFDDPSATPQPPFERPIADLEAEHTRVTLMMHSSGSTGLPKPLLLSHRSLLNTLVSGTGLKAFNALPWYHLHGLITSVQAMWMRRTAHLFNPNLPLTANNLIAALETIQPEICHCVPYGLKLIAEQERGVELLRKCKAVTSAGAPTPDELGDRMIRAGVKLGVLLGLTEVGHVGDSVLRQPGDDDWDYIRFYPHVLQHMVFKPIAPGSEICESVYLPSHPALMVTNTGDPVPGAYGSGDLFTAHPSIPGAWKFVARNDDRITLLSGEKILPLVMEGCVRESPLARDALMVGNDRLVPGMLIFRAKSADFLSDEEYLEAVWPDVERANRVADEFARLTRDMLLPIPSEVDYPATDKKNIIRAQCYRVFADRIEGLYDRRGRVASDLKAEKLALSRPELEKFILKSTKDHAGISMPDTRTDFFIAGIDSLRAAQIRRLLLQSLDLGGHDLPTNVVYDAGSVEKLAAKLYELRMETTANGGDIHAGHTLTKQIAQVEEMVEEYGQFDDWTAGSKPLPEKDTVVSRSEY
jgi:acyl-coenzyme A synthetase/AMP-(fatty) acid ligase